MDSAFDQENYSQLREQFVNVSKKVLNYKTTQPVGKKRPLTDEERIERLYVK